MTLRSTLAVHAARLIAFALCVLPASTASFALDPPAYPDAPDKEALVDYQKALTTWGNQVATTEDAFWKQTCEGFYKSTKALLDLDSLTPEERVEYNAQFAGVLANYATQEAQEGSFGAKFDELRYQTGVALRRWKLDQDEETSKIALGYATTLFNVRLNAALELANENRENAFVELVGDAITFALSFPDFGETAYKIVIKIRTFAPELGEEALDALCEAFEASENPKLVKPIQQTLGVRRYVRLPGSEPYFEAIQFNGDDSAKKFDWNDFQDKVVLIEVWATWCGPCRKEIPRLKEAYERYHDAGFEIVGYSIDQDLDALKKFMADEKIPWLMTSQKRSIEAGYKGLYDYYSINGVPEMILVGKDRNVIMTDCRGCKLADELQKLFPDVEPLGWDPATDFSARVGAPGK
ncbi:MAG: redoxin domain-containing protein [Thermoguttaceae bacterium]|nr:redoxin domain-containing protein [Thermoguttaceae bacterium]